MREWNKAIIDPSYSYPYSVFTTKGENVFHKMFSHTLIAINSEIPLLPTPHPFCNTSSSKITMIPAKVSYNIIKIAFPLPN